MHSFVSSHTSESLIPCCFSPLPRVPSLEQCKCRCMAVQAVQKQWDTWICSNLACSFQPLTYYICIRLAPCTSNSTKPKSPCLHRLAASALLLSSLQPMTVAALAPAQHPATLASLLCIIAPLHCLPNAYSCRALIASLSWSACKTQVAKHHSQHTAVIGSHARACILPEVHRQLPLLALTSDSLV